MLIQDDFKFRSPLNLKFRNNLWLAGLLLFFYIAAIMLANYLITHYGQIALPFVAFALIPFDLVIRDLMQDHWLCVPNKDRFYIFKRMTFVTFLGATISFISGTGSLRVNIASCLAFIVAGSIDALTYQWMVKYGRILRINGATLTAAITDSFIFVIIAFSSVNWKFVGLQIGMKIAGGFVWSLLLYKLFRTSEPNFPKWQPLEASISYPRELFGIPVYISEHIPNPPGIILTDLTMASKLSERFPEIIIQPPKITCWLCGNSMRSAQICKCHQGIPGQPRPPCNLQCTPEMEGLG